MQLIASNRQQSLTRVSLMLTTILTAEFSLYSRTRIAHWNVEGFDFYYKHTFFEDQYKQLDELVESVAERIRSLGNYTPAAPGDLLPQCIQPPSGNNDGRSLVKHLLHDQETLIEQLRDYLKNLDLELYALGGRDFITGLLETHEKMAWMLRAHLK